MNKTNTSYFVYELKTKFIELIKYDYQLLKIPLTMFYLLLALIQFKRKKYLESVQILSKIYRSAWAGSKGSVIYIVRKIFNDSNQNVKSEFLHQLVEQVVELENTKQFFEDPSALLHGVCIVLSPKTNMGKGVILIKYSYYFPLMFKLFNMQKIADNYHIVLEPSWAGTCEPGILAYATLNTPVFVMSYETRDTEFLKGIETNLVDLKLSSNWWVDHRKFDSVENTAKDIDIIVISTWASFKRHYFIFKALQKLKTSIPDLKVALVGYPGDLTMQDVKAMADSMHLGDITSFYEWLPPDEVSKLLQRSKVNLLWSRFEGLNRSIIEGMFCNVPCVLREGFNYGDKYSYINEQTGQFSSESKLADNLKTMLENHTNYSPRDFVLKHHTCIRATNILKEKINEVEAKVGSKLTAELAVKINALHGMEYFDPNSKALFVEDEKFILNQLKHG